MKKINLFIVGQPKSGTTALAQFLSEHPDITISNPKEIGYFCTDLHNESDAFHKYRKFYPFRNANDLNNVFEHSINETIAVEASTSYLYSRTAAKNIYKYNPDAKIIMMLRNPAEFMHSLHMQKVNETQENEIIFEKALDLEPMRKKGSHVPKRAISPSLTYYREMAKYYDQVKRYFDIFPNKNIKVIIMEEFNASNEKIYNEVIDFLGIDSFTPHYRRVHESKAPRNKTVNYLLNLPIAKNTLLNLAGPKIYTKISKGISKLVMKESPREKLSPQLKNKLLSDLKLDINETSKLIGKDLSFWQE